MAESEHGRRLIEDYLPIATINQVAQREKIGHIAAHPRKLHLWWARRPLAAARAAVYAALVPADSRDPDEDAGFFEELCRWDAPETALRRARSEILAANGGRPPRVLDLFAGGGAIPLEAARLGCEATAIELNPVAHLIERCMLEYPQRFPGLADDVREWGHRWVERAWERLADLYPPIEAGSGQQGLFDQQAKERRPLAYLWTRTVRCPNPALPEHRVPLVRQTWLARKKGRCIALRPLIDRGRLEVGWEVVEADSLDGLGFDPAAWSKRGEASCLICGTMVSGDYVKAEGIAGRMGIAPLAAVVLKPSGRGRDYLAAGSYPLPDDEECRRRLEQLGVQPPEEPLVVGDLKNVWVPLYGLTRFRDLFTSRQLLTLCTLAQGVREIHAEMLAAGVPANRAEAVATYLGLCLDRVADVNSTLTHWDNSREQSNNTFARQALPMVWDFGEANPFGDSRGDVGEYIDNAGEIIELLTAVVPGRVVRSSADTLPLEAESQDAIITDPPYYDNISYADLSDFFYVWLKRSIGHLYPEDLGGELTPKRKEFVVAPYRHHGDKVAARRFYELSMAQSFAEAHRVLKPGGPLVCIYAHKTTLGWSTLVEALRQAGFTITRPGPWTPRCHSARWARARPALPPRSSSSPASARRVPGWAVRPRSCGSWTASSPSDWSACAGPASPAPIWSSPSSAPPSGPSPASSGWSGTTASRWRPSSS
jgi:putative DNA methylase